jgi:predicted esterase
MRKFLLFLLAFILNFAGSAQTWTARQGVSMSSGTNGFYEYLPAGYSNATQYPVIIYMHGIGELGNGTTQLSLLLNNAIPMMIQNYGFPYNAIVICPQFNVAYAGGFTVNNIISYVKNNYSVNSARITLTGMSMGGAVVLDWADVGNLDQIAGIAALCPASVPQTVLVNNYKAANMPMWFFHGNQDLGFTAYSNSVSWVNQLNASPSIVPQARLTTLLNFGHNIWNTVYDYSYDIGNGQNLYQWLLAQYRGPAGNSPPIANAGIDQTITLPTNNVTLSATDSDPDGSVVSRSWTKTVGGTATITSPSSSSTTVTGLIQGTYTFRYTVTDNSGTPAFDEVTITVNPAPAPASYRVNMGAITSTIQGQVWQGGNTYTTGGVQLDIESIWGTGEDRTITNTSNQQIYKSFHITAAGATLAYPVPNGTYTIRLHFCEIWKNTPGLNVFNLSVEGTQVLSSFDVIAQAGGRYVAIYRDFPVTISDGVLNIAWIPVVPNAQGYAMLNAFELIPPVANQTPTASAGTDQFVVLPISSTTLSGSGLDQDGNITGYSWAKLSGPTGGSITSPLTASTSVTGLVSGTYVYRLTVTDNSFTTGTDDVNILVNAPPVINAGSDQLISQPASSVTLTGTASDADGSISSIVWSKISGPSGGALLTPNALSTLLTGLNPGTYVYRCAVTDNLGTVSTDDIQIRVNRTPAVNAGADQGITLPTSSVTITATASDLDGTISTYAWTGAGGTITSPSSASTTVTGLTAGSYTYRCTVTDNNGATSFDDVVINVAAAPNQSPTANAGQDQVITLPTNSVTLSGSGADQDGTISSYSWSKVAGGAATITSASSASTTVTGLAQGTYTFRLTITDNNGGVATDDIVITVNPAPNVNPTANAGTDQTITLPLSQVTVSGSGADTDGSVTSYLWTKVSGGSANILSPSSPSTVINVTAGTYRFLLTVIDNNGASGSDEVTITVNPAPNQSPIANAGADQSVTLPANISLTGTGSDPDGVVTSVLWTKQSGGSGTITSPSSLSTTVTGIAAGTYIFRLTITDNNGVSVFDDIQVTVTAAGVTYYIANVSRRIGYAPFTITASVTFTDGSKTLVQANNLNSPVRTVSVRTELVSGTYRPIAYIWFNDGSKKVITKKGD